MFLVATGSIPGIFVDNSFDERLMRKMVHKYADRMRLFDIYYYAKDLGIAESIPGLEALIDEIRDPGSEALLRGRTFV
jgi:hypothetical protein